MHRKSNRMLAKRKPNLNLLEIQTEFLHICIAGYVTRSSQVELIHVFVPSKNASIETSKMKESEANESLDVRISWIVCLCIRRTDYFQLNLILEFSYANLQVKQEGHQAEIPSLSSQSPFSKNPFQHSQ